MIGMPLLSTSKIMEKTVEFPRLIDRKKQPYQCHRYKSNTSINHAVEEERVKFVDFLRTARPDQLNITDDGPTERTDEELLKLYNNIVISEAVWVKYRHDPRLLKRALALALVYGPRESESAMIWYMSSCTVLVSYMMY
jgi:hypothetical protein